MNGSINLGIITEMQCTCKATFAHHKHALLYCYLYLHTWFCQLHVIVWPIKCSECTTHKAGNK